MASLGNVKIARKNIMKLFEEEWFLRLTDILDLVEFNEKDRQKVLDANRLLSLGDSKGTDGARKQGTSGYNFDKKRQAEKRKDSNPIEGLSVKPNFKPKKESKEDSE